MNNKEIKAFVKKARKLAKPFRVTGDNFRLKDIDPGDTLDLTSEDKPRAKEALAMGVDAAGRAAGHALRAGPLGGAADLPGDGRRRQGRRDQARHVRRQPAGLPGLFLQGADQRRARPRFSLALHEVPSRSAAASASSTAATTRRRSSCACIRSSSRSRSCRRSSSTKDIWKERFQDIRSFERYLTRNGVAIRKFFLHVSKDEQKKRFLERIEQPEKNWKFSANDAKERGYWDDYMDAYEDMIRNTATKDAPWYVVPADNKWFTRVVVAAAVIDVLSSLDLDYPKVSEGKLKELAAAKRALLAGK